jgi:hypothetical protein
MSLLNRLSVLFFVSLFAITSCQKEQEPPAITEFMSAQVEGKAFNAGTFVVARAGVTTSINGTFGPVSNPESIGLSVQHAKIGTFTFKENGEDFAVYNSPTGEYLSMSGTLQITAITGEWIEGNFNFIAHSIADPSKHMAISNGEFKMKID